MTIDEIKDVLKNKESFKIVINETADVLEATNHKFAITANKEQCRWKFTIHYDGRALGVDYFNDEFYFSESDPVIKFEAKFNDILSEIIISEECELEEMQDNIDWLKRIHNK